jgi:DNA-binding MarR family transcriptional regulator
MADTRTLDEMLGYQVHLTNLMTLRHARAALERLDITPAKVTALVYLRDCPGCDQTTLGRQLSVTRSAAMKLVGGLAQRGLIERREGRDLRSLGLGLTAQGERFLAEVLAALQQAETRLEEGLNPAERAELLRLLAKVRDNAERMPLADPIKDPVTPLTARAARG